MGRDYDFVLGIFGKEKIERINGEIFEQVYDFVHKRPDDPGILPKGFQVSFLTETTMIRYYSNVAGKCREILSRRDISEKDLATRFRLYAPVIL